MQPIESSEGSAGRTSEPHFGEVCHEPTGLRGRQWSTRHDKSSRIPNPGGSGELPYAPYYVDFLLESQCLERALVCTAKHWPIQVPTTPRKSSRSSVPGLSRDSMAQARGCCKSLFAAGQEWATLTMTHQVLCLNCDLPSGTEREPSSKCIPCRGLDPPCRCGASRHCAGSRTQRR